MFFNAEYRDLNKRPSRFICIAAFFFITGSGTHGASFDVPLHHPVYRYIDLLPLPGTVNGICLSNRPFSAASVCSILVHTQRTIPGCATAMHRFFLRQFATSAEGCPASAIPATFFFDGCRAYAYPYLTTSTGVQDSNFSIPGFNAVSVDSVATVREWYNATGVGARFFVTVRDVAIHFDGAIITEYGSRRSWTKINDPLLGHNFTTIMAERNKPGRCIGYDDFSAYIKFPLSGLGVKLGCDRVSWGYADSSGLFLSGIGKPFPLLQLDKPIGKLNYTFILGKLIGDSYRQKRILYAKHITYTHRPWISLGFSDGVLSARREIEPLYFLPFVPYYFIEHSLGSPDNRIMSFDGTLLVRSKFAVYGEFFFDDISDLLGMIRNTESGDKWAGLIGLKLYNPLPRVPLSMLRAEIVQLEPWVYATSSEPGATENNYPVHFGQVLGNRLGPHSREFSITLSSQFSKTIGGDVAVRRCWKGRGPGSSVFEKNEYVIDTVDEKVIMHQQYQTKEYRFEQFNRNRAVFSVRMHASPTEWLRISLNGDYAWEYEPARKNLMRAGLDFQISY